LVELVAQVQPLGLGRLKKGSPIRACGQRKKRCPFRFFWPVVTAALTSPGRPDSILRLHCLWFRIRPRRATARRGDSFSHPSGSSAAGPVSRFAQFRTERSGPDGSGSQLPPARFCWATHLYSRSPRLASRGRAGPAPNPGLPGSRKRSVPDRVHSMPKSSGSPKASRLPGSNPLLTHGTVESPAKFFLRRLRKW